MRPARTWISTALIAGACCTPLARTAAQTDSAAARPAPPPVAWARVTYISGESAYLDAGSKDGLREAASLTVVRAGAPIATLVVEYISSSRTSCKIVSSTEQVTIGDSVRFTPERPAAQAAAAGASLTLGAPSPSGSTTTRTRSASSFRGRIGLRYLLFDAGLGSALAQPAVDLRLDGQHLGNGPIGLTVDARAERAISNTSAISAAGANTTRVYQAALVWNPVGSPARLAVGRQFATTLSSVGLYDGASLDFNFNRWSLGAFGGYEPDLVSFGFSTLAREYGAYVQLHNARGSSPLWTLALGGVGAYAGDQIDREFGVVQATYSSRHFSLYATQEIDVNRGWKATAEQSPITPTSSFVTIMISPIDEISFDGGFDNRRNVRLYRDYVNPESTFDESFRQGEWGGTSLYLFRHIRINADVRMTNGGPAGNSQSNTGSISVLRLTPLQLGVHVRATNFTGTLADGRLQSVSLEMNPWGIIRIEGSAGTRDSSRPLDATSATRISWTGIDADFGIGRSVYLMLSTYRENGTNDRSVQSFASLSYRF